MAQIPLNAAGGSAAVVKARVPDVYITRLVRLAARRRVSRSEMTRQLLAYALDQLELADTGPPGG